MTDEAMKGRKLSAHDGLAGLELGRVNSTSVARATRCRPAQAHTLLDGVIGFRFHRQDRMAALRTMAFWSGRLAREELLAVVCGHDTRAAI